MPGVRGCDAPRLVRALQASPGRVLRRTTQGWAVFPEGDRRRRAVAFAEDALVEDLKMTGVLISKGDGFRTAQTAVVPNRNAFGATAPDRRPDAARLRSRKPGFAGLAALAETGQGPLSLGQVRAGRRLQADIERASSGGRVTMDWTFTPAGRVRRRGGEGGLSEPAAKASARLRALSGKVGADVFAVAVAACVEEVSLKALEAKFGFPKRSGAREVSAALEALRIAYDVELPASETSDI
ncbi:MAG: DUF6456 domain-containing protein [Pseudomonadota bacterium]